MTRLDDDLLDLLLATATGTLAMHAAPRFAATTALTVVMAAEGYPGTPQTGGAIGGIADAEAAGAKVFQAGTALNDGQLVASGGRVLAVTATAVDVATAQAIAYAAVDRLDFPSGFCRRDIGWREVSRQG
jgi:phosphoribosylamine--glycine ligase